ncbi:RHS domain-containing protein [Salmonella enterica]
MYYPQSFEPLALIRYGRRWSEKGGFSEPEKRIYFYHNDVNGAPLRLTDETGGVAWSQSAGPWSEQTGSVRNPLRFQGQYFDEESGLHYNRYRYYEPESGRYISADPIGLAGGLNLYAYAPNPLSWIDPLGLTSCTPKVAPPHKVINAMRDFRGKNFIFGNNIFKLDKSGLKHILERHHPEYWDGSIKAKQSFLDPKMSIADVQSAVSSVLNQNRNVLTTKGTKGMYQITGNYNGIEYVLGLNNGRVGQFYPL